MARIILSPADDTEQVVSILRTLRDLGIMASVELDPSDPNVAPRPVPKVANVERPGANGAAQSKPAARRINGPSVRYHLARKLSDTQFAKLDLNSSERTVLAYIRENGPSAMREIADAELKRPDGTVIVPKSVDGTIHALKHKNPPLIVSKPVA